MTRLQKRLEELELIQNNTKLLSELLSHYNPETGGEQERLLIKVRGGRRTQDIPCKCNLLCLRVYSSSRGFQL